MAQPDADTKDAARALADEGLGKYRDGDFVGALELFEQAEALVKTPPITLHRARSLERLGRYVAARRIYESIVALDVPKTAPAVHQRAKADAAKELVLLAEKISHLTIALDRPLPDGARLLVDGDSVAVAGTAATVDVDPGTHRVDVMLRDGQRSGESASVLSGEASTVRLTLPRDPPPPAAPRPPPPPATSSLTTVGFVGLALAGTALGVGVGAAIAAAVQEGDLSDACPTGTCPRALEDDVASLDAARFTSTGGFIAAGVFLGASVVFLIAGNAEADDTSARAPQLRFAAGPGFIGLRGELP